MVEDLEPALWECRRNLDGGRPETRLTSERQRIMRPHAKVGLHADAAGGRIVSLKGRQQ